MFLGSRGDLGIVRALLQIESLDLLAVVIRHAVTCKSTGNRRLSYTGTSRNSGLRQALLEQGLNHILGRFHALHFIHYRIAVNHFRINDCGNLFTSA